MMKPLQALLALCAIVFLPLQAADLSDRTNTTTAGKVTIADCDIAATGGVDFSPTPQIEEN